MGIIHSLHFFPILRLKMKNTLKRGKKTEFHIFTDKTFRDIILLLKNIFFSAKMPTLVVVGAVQIY